LPPVGDPQQALSLPPLAAIRDAWGRAQPLFQERSPKIVGMLEGAEPAAAQGGSIVVSLPAARAFLQKSLDSPAYRDVVEDVLGGLIGIRPRVRYEFSGPSAPAVRPDERKKDVHQDPAVRKVVDALDGGVIHVEQDRA